MGLWLIQLKGAGPKNPRKNQKFKANSRLLYLAFAASMQAYERDAAGPAACPSTYIYIYIYLSKSKLHYLAFAYEGDAAACQEKSKTSKQTQGYIV